MVEVHGRLYAGEAMSEKPLDPNDLSNPYHGWHIYDRQPSGILRLVRRLTGSAVYELQCFRFAEAVDKLQQAQRLSDIFQTELEKPSAERQDVQRYWVEKEHLHKFGEGPLVRVEHTTTVYLE